MPTLMKLLAIRMVANNLSGFWSNSSTTLFALDSSLSRLLTSAGLSEKKADSDPETKLENNSKTARTNKPDITPNVMG